LTRTVRVDLPYACFGIEVEGGVVVDAAPIARWMIRKDFHDVADWIINKGGTYQYL
jgi:hypothetical protein